MRTRRSMEAQYVVTLNSLSLGTALAFAWHKLATVSADLQDATDGSSTSPWRSGFLTASCKVFPGMRCVCAGVLRA